MSCKKELLSSISRFTPCLHLQTGMSLFPSPARCRMIPPDIPHTVIFSLPKWEDVVQLGNYSKILDDLLETTFPRHIIHEFVKQVRCMPFD